ncbi:MAG: WbqC family protein [Patescibacteria group bacterium]|jgi:hypothetical protein
MKVSIFQPTYLPWLGFFKVIDWAETYVILDHVQFEHHSWQHRNRIKGQNGALTLTVPIVREFGQNINKVKICYDKNWIKKHLDSVRMNYSKVPYFQDFYPLLESYYANPPEKLIDLNLRIIKGLCEYLGINTEFVLSSGLGAGDLRKNELLIDILKKTRAAEYLYAAGAAEYMNEAKALYEAAGIKLIPLEFEHPVYNQPHGGFISHLSIIDIIFNLGKEKTIEIIKEIKL